jgi:glycosyltransferase involved in cell wall biosynthesis
MDKPQKLESEQISFFENFLAKFNQAAQKTGEIKLFFQIAETTLCLNFAGSELVNPLTNALAHLSVPYTSNPDITINVFDSESTGVIAPAPPCDWSCFTDRGDIWGFNSKRIKTAFHWSEYSVNLLDLETNTGVYWVKSSKSFPYWVYSSPFRTLIHWWMEKNNCQLIHAAAVGVDNKAILITGKGGSGKSTTSLTCLNRGLKFLGDDYVIVKKDPVPFVYSLYCSAKINVDDIVNFPELVELSSPKVAEDQEKEVLFIFPKLKELVEIKMPLVAILTPVIQPTEITEITPTNFWPIQRAISFTTITQLPGVGKHTQIYINEFITKLPCFTLKLGFNLKLVPEVIEQFVDSETYTILNDDSDTDCENPLISVIVPIYNGAQFISDAIQHILDQKYQPLEIIIVDDGSTDDTKKIIDKLSIDIRYFHQPNSGPAAARNRGIRNASGDFIAFLDVDDFWPENMLKTLMNELKDDSELEVVRGYAQLFRKDELDNIEYLGNAKESFPSYIGAGLYRKSIFDKVGLYDQELRFGEDGDWFNRAEEKNIAMKRIEDITLYVQRHESNMTKGKNLVELNILKVFKKKKDRIDSGESTKPPLAKSISVNHKNELISVIIVVHNGAAFIADAIENVMQQQYSNLEIIVIDDGSSDQTAEIVKMTGLNIVYVYQNQQGVASARNLGIEHAKGKYVAFLDADDLWSEDKLNTQISILNDNPTIGGTLGFTHKTPMSKSLEQIKQNAQNDNYFALNLGAALFKLTVIKQVGLFDTEFNSGEDIDWFFRAREKNIQLIIHKQIVHYFRIHGKNISNDQKMVNSELLKVHKKSIDRRSKTDNSTFSLPRLNQLEDILTFWQGKEI